MEDQKEQVRIRRRAYELWKRQGCPEVRAEDFGELAKPSLAEETPEISTGESAAGSDSGTRRSGRALKAAALDAIRIDVHVIAYGYHAGTFLSVWNDSYDHSGRCPRRIQTKYIIT